jgi:signal-transduction protein with cAMP-binding, CBS, and nucleotidyltransferase domain
MNSLTEQNHACIEYRTALDLLIRIPLFSVIPVEAVKVLACLCQSEIFAVGEIVFQQNEIDDHAYYILHGEAELLLRTEESEQKIRGFVQGDFIGGFSLIAPMERLFSLRAKTDLVCLAFSADDFQKTLSQFPEAALEILKEIASEVFQWEYRLLHGQDKLCPKCKDSTGVTLLHVKNFHALRDVKTASATHAVNVHPALLAGPGDLKDARY